MKGLVYKENHQFVLENREKPVLLKPTDALIRVTLASICSSDLHIKEGYVKRAIPGIVVGHEMVGVVEEIGAGVTSLKIGDRVAVNVETFCGECFYCQRGFVNNCTHQDGGWALGCRIDGGQAEYVRVPFADNGLSVIPEGVSDEDALFTGDILSTGYWAAQLGEIKPEDTVVVLGAGPTGLCTMMCARLYGPKEIIAVDRNQERLDLAKRNGWADTVCNVEKEELSELILGKTNGRGADVVMEAAGGCDTFQTAWKIARPNGIVCVVAMYGEPQMLPLPQMYGKNLVFKTGGVDACHCGEIIELIAKGKLNTRALITHEFKLEEIMDAYKLFESKQDGVIKIAIRCS